MQIAFLIDEGQSPSAKILRKLGGNGFNYGLEILVTVEKVEKEMVQVETQSTNVIDDMQAVFRKAHFYFYSEQDFHKAANLFKVCSDGRSAAAAYYLGLIYQHGLGTRKDSNLAEIYYRLGAENGFIDSAFNLAYLYLVGCGIQKDEGEALKWFQVAAEHEHIDACFNLAFMYEYGKGVPCDSLAAQGWLELAIEYGDNEAMDILYGEREICKESLRTPYQELKLLSDNVEMRFYQNLFELHEQDISFPYYSEELSFIDDEDNKMEKYLLLLHYFIKVERESRIIIDQQRKIIRLQCIPNHLGGQVDLIDATLLLDSWCDDMDLNHRKYLNAFRFNTLVEFMSETILRAVRSNMADSYYWRGDYLNVLSRAMINLAICYRNMNMFHTIPASIAKRGFGLAICSFVICPLEDDHSDFQDRLEASASIYDFFKDEWGNDTESILIERRNKNYSFYQKCRYLEEFYERFYCSKENISE